MPMAAEVDAERACGHAAVVAYPAEPQPCPRVTVPMRRFLGHHIFSSLTRRILILNLAGLAVLVVGILYLNTFRDGLIDARVESLMTQGEIIAGAIAASATVETDAITHRSGKAA
jgi:two-component system sensor histidine kinase ChvG